MRIRFSLCVAGIGATPETVDIRKGPQASPAAPEACAQFLSMSHDRRKRAGPPKSLAKSTANIALGSGMRGGDQNLFSVHVTFHSHTISAFSILLPFRRQAKSMGERFC